MVLLHLSRLVMKKIQENRYLVQCAQSGEGMDDCFSEITVIPLDRLLRDEEVLNKLECLKCDAASSPRSHHTTILRESDPMNLPSVRKVLFRMASLQACGYRSHVTDMELWNMKEEQDVLELVEKPVRIIH